MSDTESRKVLTANRLDDGSIVYMALSGNKPLWVNDIKEAKAFGDSEVSTMESMAETEVAANVVVSPYVIDTTVGIAPTSAKETVRATGPSVEYGHAARKTSFQN
jgi:hypothetical protein